MFYSVLYLIGANKIKLKKKKTSPRDLANSYKRLSIDWIKQAIINLGVYLISVTFSLCHPLSHNMVESSTWIFKEWDVDTGPSGPGFARRTITDYSNWPLHYTYTLTVRTHTCMYLHKNHTDKQPPREGPFEEGERDWKRGGGGVKRRRREDEGREGGGGIYRQQVMGCPRYCTVHWARWQTRRQEVMWPHYSLWRPVRGPVE